MIEIRPAITPADLESARALFTQYGAIPQIGECVVGFATEIEGLPGKYAEPEGTLLLAGLDGRVAGCGALRCMTPRSRSGRSGRSLKRSFLALRPHSLP